MKSAPFAIILLCILLLAAVPAPAQPEQPVKLVFIHHSTGENWLTDGYGDLGRTLSQNNYFVSDTNYGWGPDGIGDRTDIPDWEEWFASDQTPTYTNTLYNESGQNSNYTRSFGDPGGENEIIMFKSCFPNSELGGSPNDPAGDYADMTVAGAKYVYNTILDYFASRPDKLFIVVTAPPVSDPSYADNARAFNDWLRTDWLSENNYPYQNVGVFDFYNVLTCPNAHHTYSNGQILYVQGAGNTLYYPSDDDHPSVAGSQKATEDFIPLLNYYYEQWQMSEPVEQGEPESETEPQTESETEGETEEENEVEQEAEQAGPVSMQGGLIDDFEGPLPPGTNGWEGYFGDSGTPVISCMLDDQANYTGLSSLQFSFELPPESWTTCGLYYDSVQDWSSYAGVTFYMHAREEGIPFDVHLYSGTPDERSTYVYSMQTSELSLTGWMPVTIPWEEIVRVDWEENPGTPINPTQITGISIGISTYGTEALNSVLWLDDLRLMDSSAPVQSEPEPEQADVQEEAAEVEEEESSSPLGQICPGFIMFPFLVVGVVLSRKKRQNR